jgi:hypothetical protein
LRAPSSDREFERRIRRLASAQQSIDRGSNVGFAHQRLADKNGLHACRLKSIDVGHGLNAALTDQYAIVGYVLA